VAPRSATAEIFDPADNSVTPTGSLTTPRVGPSATTLIDGRVLIAGGRNGTSESALATAEIYDPVASNTFTPLPTQMSAGRAGHTPCCFRTMPACSSRWHVIGFTRRFV
jgi:hypothetical protein